MTEEQKQLLENWRQGCLQYHPEQINKLLEAQKAKDAEIIKRLKVSEEKLIDLIKTQVEAHNAQVETCAQEILNS